MEGLLFYSDPLLSIPLLLLPVLSGVAFDPTSIFVGISLMGCLSLGGLVLMQVGLFSASIFMSVVKRIEEVLLLP